MLLDKFRYFLQEVPVVHLNIVFYNASTRDTPRNTMSNEEGLKEVIELLHELKLELVAEMDYASLELQVEAVIDKMYALTEGN